jgi:hypothetical protein
MQFCSGQRRGASAVELALLLPILGLLFVFAVDFARLYYHYSIVTNCARNGALYASGTPADQRESPYGDVTAAALADASNLSPQPAVTVSPPGSNPVWVSVTYPFTTICTYPGIPNPINLTRKAWMNSKPLLPISN